MSSRALSNITGGGNVADGSFALANSTRRFDNVAVGHGALIANQTGSHNVAIGKEALENNTTGTGNIAVGVGAGDQVTTGSQNIYISERGRWPHRLVECFHSPLIDRMNPGRSSSRSYRIRK